MNCDAGPHAFHVLDCYETLALLYSGIGLDAAACP